MWLAFGLSACSTSAPPPRPPQPQAQHHVPPDWFHRELALARHARMTHLPPGDTAGAQRAYYKVMLPACQRVAKSGPDKYRARCKALTDHAAADAAAANNDFDCMPDQDDSQASQAEKTACND